MKEKNLNNIHPGQDHNQDDFSARTRKDDETPVRSSEDHEQQDSFTDEYDSYSPWG